MGGSLNWALTLCGDSSGIELQFDLIYLFVLKMLHEMVAVQSRVGDMTKHWHIRRNEVFVAQCQGFRDGCLESHYK